MTPPEPSPPAGRLARAREAPASTALVAAQLLALVAVALLLGDPSDPRVLVRAGALERGRVLEGEWWRLASAVFLHWGWVHLAVNATQWPLDRLVERALGTRRFVALYLAAGVAGSALSLAARDAVSAGASGAIFGMVGATFALRRRALPSWRAFAADPAVRLDAGWIAAWSLLGLALPMDHFAHLGGLVAGGWGAWVVARPAPRSARAWVAPAAAAALLLGAALWPRPGLSRWQRLELAEAVHEALHREDRAGAAALLDRARRAGAWSEPLDYYAAFLAVQEDRLEEAAARLRPLARGAAEPVRTEARAALGQVTWLLGYRAYTGDGAPRDAEAGLALIEEACAAGIADACDAARWIRQGGDRPPPGPAPIAPAP